MYYLHVDTHILTIAVIYKIDIYLYTYIHIYIYLYTCSYKYLIVGCTISAMNKNMIDLLAKKNEETHNNELRKFHPT
jgi:3D (Asp-Asp-Asp) domain-containing protein